MDFVILQIYDNYIPAHIAMGRLEEEGITCWLKDENTVTMNAAWTQAVGGIKLMVAETDFTKASGLLKELEDQHKVAIVCPKCGSHNIEIISTPRKAVNWISVLLGFLFVNYAMPVETVNHCFDCSHEFPAFEENKTNTNDLVDN
jgi:DNA-directed RNA polymerase subunit RPC12/RpoP